jgi:hypothetical protein
MPHGAIGTCQRYEGASDMLTLRRRVFATVLFALLAMTASLTVAGTPANAAYSPQMICNHSTVHRGQAVACTIHHFLKHHHGTITVRARFWVHKKGVHHHVLSKHVLTKTLGHFVTSHHGGRIVAFNVPLHIRLGTHSFSCTTGSKVGTDRLRVVKSS